MSIIWTSPLAVLRGAVAIAVAVVVGVAVGIAPAGTKSSVSTRPSGRFGGGSAPLEGAGNCSDI